MPAPRMKDTSMRVQSSARRGLTDHHPITRLKHFVFGHPLRTSSQNHERLGYWLGLPILAVDTISSLAYATEEILMALTIGGIYFIQLSTELATLISCLILALIFSYVQAVKVYPEGGGAYVVAKQNLSPLLSIIAASSLVVDYILTVAVSVTAGVRALASAFPILNTHLALYSMGGILFLAWINLHGIRESARLITIPAYGFIIMVLALGIMGFNQALDTPPHASNAEHMDAYMGWVAALIILRAFSGGCTALTGIEAVANAGRILKDPIARNAGRILLSIAAILSVAFLTITYSAESFHLLPKTEESIMSQFTRYVIGDGFFYQLFQILTAIILFLAANTAYAGFPRLSAMMAKDRWLPKQLSSLGDRLVFSYGITWLSILAIALVFFFEGETHALIPLYALGVFTAFTLNQLGMIAHWRKQRVVPVLWPHAWMKRLRTYASYTLAHPKFNIGVNVFGATLTAAALLITLVGKFAEGGYIVLIALPLLIWACYQIHAHYDDIEEKLKVNDDFIKSINIKSFSNARKRTVIVPVSRLHKGALKSLAFAREISRNVIALVVDTHAHDAEKTIDRIKDLNWGIRTVYMPSPYRSITRPIVEFVHDMDKADEAIATVVLPEIVPAKWWQNFLHNRTADDITKLLSWSEYIPNEARIVINVPFHVGQ